MSMESIESIDIFWQILCLFPQETKSFCTIEILWHFAYSKYIKMKNYFQFFKYFFRSTFHSSADSLWYDECEEKINFQKYRAHQSSLRCGSAFLHFLRTCVYMYKSMYRMCAVGWFIRRVVLFIVQQQQQQFMSVCCVQPLFMSCTRRLTRWDFCFAF